MSATSRCGRSTVARRSRRSTETLRPGVRAYPAEVESERVGGWLRRTLGRLAASEDELEAQELRADTVERGATPIAQCTHGEEVCRSGNLRLVTLRPRAGIPALEAELYDGSGVISLVWLGRRRIAGIDPGRDLVAHGRLTLVDGRRTVFNPTYELRPVAGE